MPKGPQEARLDRAVSGASPAAIRAAEREWRNGAMALDNVAMALDMAGPQVIAKFGGTHTGPAAQKAFQQVAEKVRARKAQMERAADALANADIAAAEAKKVQASLGALPSEPSRPDIAPGTNDVDAVRQQRVYATQLGSYQSAMADREAKSEAAANEMDRVYRDSTATMKQVHGEPDSRSGGANSAGGAGGGGGAGAATSGGSSSGATVHAPGASGSTAVPHASHSTSTSSTGPTGSTHVVAPPGAQPPVITTPGTAQDGAVLPPAPTPTVLGASGAPVSSTSGTSAAGGLVGALGGGLMGGAAGIGGAVRGGVAPVSTSATSAARIGATARTGAAGAIGRGGVAGTSTTARAGALGTSTRASTAGTAARTTGGASTTGSAGRTVGRGAAGSAGAAGGRGTSTGRSGTRLGPRGAGVATGRGGAKGEDDPTNERDLFESDQDWVDDEDAAPGLID